MKTSNSAKTEKTATTGRAAGTASATKAKSGSTKTHSDGKNGSDKDEKSDKRHPGTTTHKKNRYTGDADSDFHTFFVDELKDIYWAEKHLKPGLAKMSKASTSEELAAAFDKHRDEGNGQIATLETIFELLGEKPEAKRCDAMAGLLKEAESIIEDTKRNSYVRDAGLILAAQKVEHYEIATYGTLLALSAFLPEKRVKKLLAETLAEEKKTDAALTQMAESFINECAAVE